MTFIFRYFWFIAAAFMLVNILVWRQRSEAAISSGILSQEEFDHFIRWASIWLVGLPLLLGLIGLAAKWPSVLCAGMLSFSDVPQILFSLAVLFAWASLLWWLWLDNGAEFISHVLPSLNQTPTGQRRYSPRAVRLVLTAVVVINAVVTPIIWRAIPIPPNTACSTP